MTEELDTDLPGVRTLRTGSGCFSDRLTAALVQLPHQYVLYVQDDFWPIQHCPALTFQRLLVGDCLPSSLVTPARLSLPSENPNVESRRASVSRTVGGHVIHDARCG
jgi:hypothetical protein